MVSVANERVFRRDTTRTAWRDRVAAATGFEFRGRALARDARAGRQNPRPAFVRVKERERERERERAARVLISRPGLVSDLEGWIAF